MKEVEAVGVVRVGEEMVVEVKEKVMVVVVRVVVERVVETVVVVMVVETVEVKVEVAKAAAKAAVAARAAAKAAEARAVEEVVLCQVDMVVVAAQYRRSLLPDQLPRLLEIHHHVRI